MENGSPLRDRVEMTAHLRGAIARAVCASPAGNAASKAKKLPLI